MTTLAQPVSDLSSTPASASHTERTTQEFARLFCGRDDIYGTFVPAADGSDEVYEAKHGAVTEDHYAQHLAGARTLGIYPLLDNGTCRWACLDFDTPDIEPVRRCQRTLAKYGSHAYIETSKRKGHHLWVLFSAAVSAKHVRRVLRTVLREADCDPDTEVFPKQDTLKTDHGARFGNMVNLPYAGNAAPGRRVMLDEQGASLSLEEFLLSVRTNDPACLDAVVSEAEVTAAYGVASSRLRVVAAYELIQMPARIPEGQRHDTLLRLACSRFTNDLDDPTDPEQMYERLGDWYERLCDEETHAMKPAERWGIAEFAAAKKAEDAAEAAALTERARQAVAATVSDTGSAFTPEAVAALSHVAATDAAEWARLRTDLKAALKPAGLGLKAIDDAIKDLRSQRAAECSTVIEPTAVGAVFADAPAPSLRIPAPYELSAEGTFIRRSDGRGVPSVQPVAPAPLFIASRQRDTETGEEALTLAWRWPGQPWRQRIVNRGEALDARKLVQHASHGLPVTSGSARDAVEYLARLEGENYADLHTERVTSHLGWQQDGGFLWGEQLFGGSNEALAFRGADAGDAQLAAGYRSAGTYAGWYEAIAPLHRFPTALVVFYAAFTPPLLKALGVTPFIVDLAKRTSVGKTTVQRVAASIWGQPSEMEPDSVLRTWDATAVFIERLSALASDMPVILDDTNKCKNPEDINNLIYRISGGQGRGRGSQKGLQQAGTWRTVLISSGEAPATSYSQNGGARMRCLTLTDLPFGAVCPETAKVVNAINGGVLAHFGHAGPRFVAWLTEQRREWDEYRARYRAASERLMATAPNPEAGRLAQCAAAVDVASQLVHEALELPWTYADPLSGLWTQIAAEAGDAAGELRALRDIHAWASGNPERFWRKSANSLMTQAPFSGWLGRWDADAIAFLPHALEDELQRRKYPMRAILEGWRDRGWLDTETDERLKKKVNIGPSGDRPYAYVINRAALVALGEIDD